MKRTETRTDPRRGLWLRTVRQAALIVAVALVPAALAAFLHPRRPAWTRDGARVPEVEWAAVRDSRHPVLIVDARNAAAFERAHIPGAVLFDAGANDEGLVTVARAWRPGMRLVVYCDSPRCAAAQNAAMRLRRELGLADIVVLKGGWSAWTGAHGQDR